MVNIPELFKKGYEYLETAIAQGIFELRKDKVDIIQALDPKNVVAAVQGLQNTIKTSLSDVKNAVDDKYVAEEFKITNPEDITDKLSEKLDDVISAIKLLLGKDVEKEIVIKNDLSSLVSLFKTDSDKKDLIAALAKIENKLKFPEQTDYTSILSDIATACEKEQAFDLGKVELSLLEIIKKLGQEPKNYLDKYDNGDGRLKVETEEIAKSVKQGLYGYSHENKLKNKDGVLINPSTSEKQDEQTVVLGSIAGELASRLAIIGDYIYEGNALPGSATSSAVWQISRFDKVNFITAWADANSNFDNVWDNHLSLTYS